MVSFPTTVTLIFFKCSFNLSIKSVTVCSVRFSKSVVPNGIEILLAKLCSISVTYTFTLEIESFTELIDHS